MHRVTEDAEIADTITRICIDVKARKVLKSGEQMIAALKGLDESLESAGIGNRDRCPAADRRHRNSRKKRG